MTDREYRCAGCNRTMGKDAFFDGIRKDAGPRGGYGQPVCDDCLDRESKGLPIERHGEKAKCEDKSCAEYPHPVLCEDCEKPVLLGDRRGPPLGETDYGPHREKKDGMFLHCGIHYACTNERAHAKLKRRDQA